MAATVAASVQRIEVVGDRRRAHDAVFRAQLVAESLVPGARVQELARRHGICTSLIYRWRRLASSEAQPGSSVWLHPVRITGPQEPQKPVAAEPVPPSPEAARRSGLIEIELEGGVRVRVDGDVGLTSLRRVLAALRG